MSAPAADLTPADTADIFDAPLPPAPEQPLKPPPIPPPRGFESRVNDPPTDDGPGDSSMNDTSRGHLPLQVENDIDELGKFFSLMQPQDLAKAHDYGPMLEEFGARGVPVDCGEDWSREQIMTAIERGPHKGALTEDAIELFEEDIAYQVKAGFSRIVLLDDIIDDLPRKLKISPVAAIPQKNRRPRIILDLSFPVKLGNDIIQQAVNATTAQTSHPSALSYLGSTLPRILKFIAHAPEDLPIYFSKYDISDGFWRMVVAQGEEWNFAYVLPQKEGEPTRLVVPSALQMGWRESPGFFCAASETARDIAEEFAGFQGRMADLPIHKFEKHIQRPMHSDGDDAASDATPWAAIECFVDDFMVMAQAKSRLAHLSRSVMHAIEQVFPPPSVTGHVGGKDPISEKKILRGEADWETSKEVLGWLVDGDKRTVQLSPDKAEAYAKEIKLLLRKGSRRVQLKRFREIVGKLRFAALCLPTGKSFMTPLNMALKGLPAYIGLGKKSEVREALGDWLQLLKELAQRPTHIREIVAKSVDFYGYCDACNTGAGGVWLPLDRDCEPFIWRVQWPPDIVRKLTEYDQLSISDAECAGVLLHQLALEQAIGHLKHVKTVTFCDNTPAVSWVTRMASRQSRIGGRLARGLAIRSRAHQMCTPTALSVAGDANGMADTSSRSMNERSGYLLSDNELLTHFSKNFPLPQNRCWRIVNLPTESISSVVSTLRGKQLTMAQWMTTAANRTGAIGNASPPSGTSTSSSPAAPTANKQTSCVPLLTGCGKVTSDEATESLRSLLTEQSVPLARPSSWLSGATQRRSMEAASASFHSAGFSKGTAVPTRPRSRN